MADRVVFDTSAMISGLLWKGKSYHCLLLARAGVIRSVYCNPMLADLTEKLREKFKYTENQIHAVVADIRKYGEQVEISGELKMVHQMLMMINLSNARLQGMHPLSYQATTIC